MHAPTKSTEVRNVLRQIEIMHSLFFSFILGMHNTATTEFIIYDWMCCILLLQSLILELYKFRRVVAYIYIVLLVFSFFLST